MALLAQDVIVTLICAGALAMVVRRVAGAVRNASPAQMSVTMTSWASSAMTQTTPAARMLWYTTKAIAYASVVMYTS